MRPSRHRIRGSGFTTIEIMIALAIISVILAIGLPTYTEHRKRVLIAEAAKDIVLISQRLEKYHSFNYRYPEYLADMGLSMQDPWGNDYQYLNLEDVDPDSGTIKTGDKGPKPTPRKKKDLKPLNTGFDLFSTGEDGVYRDNVSAKQSLDDVIRADNGGYVGVAADY